MVVVSSAPLRNGVHAGWWYLLAVVVVLLDQYTKGLASEHLRYAQPEPVFSWFNLTLHHNPGAAFSFLSDAGGWQRYFFTGVAALVSVALVVWLVVMPRGNWLLPLAVALILGGALGNLWDRVALGYVVDFISVHYRDAYFPAFNLADSAITGGAIAMILDSFINKPDTEVTQRD
jgi:signal peptidase II